jgi:tellurite methyltransferase
MDNKSIDWTSYFENTKNFPPAPLLVKALGYVKAKNKAIDIGGGATLKDTKYLLSEGFETTLIDKEKMVEAAVLNVHSEKLKFFLTDFVDFDFPRNEYDIAAAIYSLPFIPPDLFADVFVRVKKSLVKDGIFCGQFFGNRDGWHLNTQLTFVTKEKAQSVLEDMDIILFDEKEFDGKTADGSPKHWHVFDIIARKK